MSKILYSSETPRPTALLHTGRDPWWVETVKKQKVEWMQSGKFNGDMPPLIMPLKSGYLLAYVLSPDLHPDAAVEGVLFCRRAMEADTIIVVTDAHIPIGEYSKRVVRELMSGQYRVGQMQKMCDDEDACKRKLLTDCMMVSRLTRTSLVTNVLAYDYEGPDGFTWTPEHDIAYGSSSIVHETAGLNLRMLQAMRMTSLVDDKDVHQFAEMTGAEDIYSMSREKLSRCFCDGAIRFMRDDRGWTVHDFRNDPMKVE